MGKLEDLIEKREALNKKILDRENINIKRFFGIDAAAYRDGALDAKTKELLGLVASTVMRCDECISYHLIRCVEQGLSDEELDEAMSIALIVGGSITIPNLRKAYDIWDDLKEK